MPWMWRADRGQRSCFETGQWKRWWVCNWMNQNKLYLCVVFMPCLLYIWGMKFHPCLNVPHLVSLQGLGPIMKVKFDFWLYLFFCFGGNAPVIAGDLGICICIMYQFYPDFFQLNLYLFLIFFHIIWLLVACKAY